jgi:hypothetical protein
MMSSIWICADASSPKNLSSKKRSKLARLPRARPLFLGVFTDDPANIGRWLPRPVTPFVPAPEPIIVNKLGPVQTIGADISLDSPPPGLPLDLSAGMTTEISPGMHIF